MRLSASICFFNAEELLPACVEAILPCVDHLSIVWQAVSNFGTPMSEEAHEALDAIAGTPRVELCAFTPDLTLAGAANEYRKRAIGIARARAQQMSHILLMDADEFYEAEAFHAARTFIEANDIATTAVHQHYYIKRPTLRISGLPETHVPFITRLDAKLVHGDPKHPAGVVDRTRSVQVPGERFHFFEEREIVMHHMSAVRHSMRAKLRDSTHNDNPASMPNLLRQALAVERWQPERGPLIINGQRIPLTTEPDRFDLCRLDWA